LSAAEYRKGTEAEAARRWSTIKRKDADKRTLSSQSILLIANARKMERR